MVFRQRFWVKPDNLKPQHVMGCLMLVANQIMDTSPENERLDTQVLTVWALEKGTPA